MCCDSLVCSPKDRLLPLAGAKSFSCEGCPRPAAGRCCCCFAAPLLCAHRALVATSRSHLAGPAQTLRHRRRGLRSREGGGHRRRPCCEPASCFGFKSLWSRDWGVVGEVRVERSHTYAESCAKTVEISSTAVVSTAYVVVTPKSICTELGVCRSRRRL